MTTFALPIPKRPTHPTGIINWLTTIDHKRIGILYGITAFILFLTGGIEAILMRLQLAAPGMDLVSPEIYNQLFTMHGTTMIFLAIMPMGAAFFNFLPFNLLRAPIRRNWDLHQLKKSNSYPFNFRLHKDSSYFQSKNFHLIRGK